MKHTRISSDHNTPTLKAETKSVTITHPFHPLYGKTGSIIRSRRGVYARLTVKLADGTQASVDPIHTDFGLSLTDRISTRATILLDIDGLLNIVKVINQIKGKG